MAKNTFVVEVAFQLSNDIYIHFALGKEIGKIAVLKRHAETPNSILNTEKFRASSHFDNFQKPLTHY